MPAWRHLSAPDIAAILAYVRSWQTGKRLVLAAATDGRIGYIAVLVGVIAVVIFGNGRVALGLVVFLAMVSAMTAAAVVGAIAPAAMQRFGIDPAIASGPFVTTANDIIGIAIYMSTALLFLDQLIG